MRLPRLAVFLCCAGCVASGGAAWALDQNANQQSDLWELAYDFFGRSPEGDEDGDGFSNAVESLFGTDPRSFYSRPELRIEHEDGAVRLWWEGVAGKTYRLSASNDLRADSWQPGTPLAAAQSGPLATTLPAAERRFFRLTAQDVDSDGDGLSDAEEFLIGFDPASAHTQRYDQEDLPRAIAGLTAENTITVSVYDDTASERWPDPVLFVVRRAGGLQPLAVNVAFGGSATRGADYTTPAVVDSTVVFRPGQREVFIEAVPVADAEDDEPTETLTLTALPGPGYTVGAPDTATAQLLNETATSPPSPKEAARFLLQAAFGPDQDAPDDLDQIPENVEEIQSLGFASWIEDQFTRPVGRLQPFVEWVDAFGSELEIYGDAKNHAWWNRAMGVPTLRPDEPATQAPDPLRQRVAFALSQIFVISDRLEDLGVEPAGMANYYDHLLAHSFGNYRDLLRGVALHPCMGLYLSHLGNRKADPDARVFPDENFAREIMQLFSIGLWELNPDGTRRLDAQGQPIPSYTNDDITEFARVFTGLAFGNNDNFGLWPRDFTVPMKGWDAEHDLGPKTLLRGQTTPARNASPGNTGAATLADVDAAIDNLFHHPNTGPFISRQLIQRFVTSNPSPAYIGRVAAAFADNGAGVRGDLQAVIKALLLDPEARDPAMMNEPTFGKLREPFLRCVNVARAFNATAADGFYALDAFNLDHAQQPFNSPSVFNFYLPGYSPPGALTEAGLVAPEFQLINAASVHTGANYFWNAITGELHRWGTGRASRATRLDLIQEMRLNVPPAAFDGAGNVLDQPNVAPLDPDPLLRRLDLVLTGGTLRAEQFQIIREALDRVRSPIWTWPKERLRLAIYLIVVSPDFNVLR